MKSSQNTSKNKYTNNTKNTQHTQHNKQSNSAKKSDVKMTGRLWGGGGGGEG